MSSHIVPGRKTTLTNLLVAVVIGMSLPQIAQASIQYSGVSGTKSATADFDLTGSTLTITLTNTSTSDAMDPTDVLTGLFFNTTTLLTPVSASLNGSTTFYGAIVNNVGEGWQYKSGISAQGKNSGISAAGLGAFGPSGDFFSSGVTVNGLDYGILTAGDNSVTANGGLTHGPLFKNSLQFVLTAAAGFSLSQLGNDVQFQYGTDFSEPHFTGTSTPTMPEPGAVLVWALLGVCALSTQRSIGSRG